MVMYAGRKVEEAGVEEIFARSAALHQGLLASIPRLDLIAGDRRSHERLQAIPGIVPALASSRRLRLRTALQIRRRQMQAPNTRR